MQLDPTIFKAYDIRGLVPDQINPQIAGLIGLAFSQYSGNVRWPMVIGHDARSDSIELAKAMVQATASQGRHVVDIGLVTTDMLYFATGLLDTAGGVMVTASHNPGRYNGLKLSGNQAAPIGVESGLQKIRKIAEGLKFADTAEPGQIIQRTIDSEWIDHALNFVGYGTWPQFKVAIDTGNGSAGPIMQELQRRLPVLEITPMYWEPDGTFPNHAPDPSIEANIADLVTTVNSHKLDLGIAFDGDGDRAFFVDETGTPVSASAIACLLAQRCLNTNPGAKVLYDLRMSQIVPETIEAAGGKAIRTPVGGGHIRPMIRKEDGVLACEGSGHYYYRDNYYSDSGLITALMVIDILATSGKRLSELVAPFNKYAKTEEISVEVSDAAAIVERVAQKYKDCKQDHLDGLTVTCDDWWFNLRPSNTQPLIRLNVEATTPEVMTKNRVELLELIKQ